MKLWTKIKRLFRKSKPTLCWIDHFSGVKAICWVRIAEDMAVKAVFPAEGLRHLVAGDAFYYDLETKQFSDAEEEPIVVALNDFQAAFEGDQDAQARLDAAFDTIDWTKPIQTRDGRKAEFVRKILQPPHDFGDDYLCIVDVGNGYEEPVQYFKNGKIGLDEESNHDIINVAEHERIKQELEQPNNEV